MRLKEFTEVPSTSATNAFSLIVWVIVALSFNTGSSKHKRTAYFPARFRIALLWYKDFGDYNMLIWHNPFIMFMWLSDPF